ncbi:MAG: HD domain-containing protein [Firmicutes bacterium]|nr:HD domain-containing protein [Bacillota bacterium]
MTPELPDDVLALAHALAGASGPAGRAQVFLVGGALRDALLGRVPHDYDLATDLTPEAVARVARAHGWAALPTGERFGTVSVIVFDRPIEVTTFRAEAEYADGRRPASVSFVRDVRLDLARRDFTVNAIALELPGGRWIDPFGGREDLRRRLLRTVGDPAERFREDGLRLLRAVRLAAELLLRIEDATALAMAVHAEGLGRVAAERVGPELQRLLLAPGAAEGLRRLVFSGLASVALPELVPAVGLPPDHEYHALPLFEHLVEVTRLVPPRPALRWAALFHDVAKPFCRTEEGGRVHYYGHDTLGAEMFAAAARRLRLERRVAEAAQQLIARHMFTFDMGPKGMRRVVAQLGEEGARDLLALKLADMAGTGGRFVGAAYDAFLAFRERFEAALAEATAFTVRDLAVDGHDVMRELGLAPGPRVGRVLAVLLEEVLEDPAANDRAHLLQRIREIGASPEEGAGAGEGPARG